MSLTGAMSAAVSGMTATNRAVDTVAANVANAMTDGYAPREIRLASASIGGGVRVVGVERQADPVLGALLRQAGGTRAGADVLQGFWNRVEQVIGLPGDIHGLGGKVAAFETALTAAAARPDLDNRLAAVADSAGDLLRHLHQTERLIQDQRLNADTAIARDIDELNHGLERIARLNLDIVRLQASGHSPLGLLDEREKLIASLSEIVPIRELHQSDGRVALYTEGGALLLDTRPARFEFAPAAGMEAGLTLAGGQLSAVTLNGIALGAGAGGPLAGGRLAANLDIRDSSGPQAQAMIDAIAAELVTRFSGTDTNPDLPPGQAGLFTDADPSTPAGLAGRIALNALVDPGQGGALWRLRDGLGAVTPGVAGDTEQMHRWLGALQQPLALTPGATARDFTDNLGRVLADISQSRQSAEDRAGHAIAFHMELTAHALARGVDVDEQMQRLLLIEKAFAANMRVFQVADDLLRRLMEI